MRIVCGQIGNPYGDLTRRDLQLRTLELAVEGRLVRGLPRRTMPVAEAADGFDALTRPDELLQVEFAYDVA